MKHSEAAGGARLCVCEQTVVSNRPSPAVKKLSGSPVPAKSSPNVDGAWSMSLRELQKEGSESSTCLADAQLVWCLEASALGELEAGCWAKMTCKSEYNGKGGAFGGYEGPAARKLEGEPSYRPTHHLATFQHPNMQQAANIIYEAMCKSLKRQLGAPGRPGFPLSQVQQKHCSCSP